MKQTRIVTALCAAAFCLTGSATFAAELSYRTYVVSPAINNWAILEGGALPKVCKTETTMKIMAARGEYEPASFLVETDELLKQVMVTVSPLQGAAGTLPTEAVDVRVVQPYFRRITDLPTTLPWILLHDPELLVIEERTVPTTDKYWGQLGYTRRNRLTREAVDTKELQPADIEQRRQFWITVHMPDGAAAGTYTANVRITANNAPATELKLEVTVPDFELLLPMFEYSIYWPVHLKQFGWPTAIPYGAVSEEQYLAEARNMVAHGCTNPNLCWVHLKGEEGKEDPRFDVFERVLTLCEQAGMKRGRPLYVMFNDHASEPTPRELTREEMKVRTERVRKVVDWATRRGYPEVYWAAGDEFSGERLRLQRDSMQAIHDGGGKVFVACFKGYYELVGDLLDRPVFYHSGNNLWDQSAEAGMSPIYFLTHPEEMAEPLSPKVLMDPETRKVIKGVHDNGYRIFTYMDPIAGMPLPEVHRRNKGLGIWKVGTDGTMPWAYTHIENNNAEDKYPIANQHANGTMSAVFRAKGEIWDTLSWEAYREGVDDARYLTTLMDALKRAKAAGRHADLVAETETWLEQVALDTDLDAWRREMARRTEALLE